MDAVKYLKESNRMCDSSNCSKCPLYEKNNGKRVNCQVIEKKYAEEAVSIVEKWSAEHPVKTRQSEFLKMFPNALTEDGVLDVSPCEIDVNYFKGCEDNTGCQRCKKDYWLAEVE